MDLRAFLSCFAVAGLAITAWGHMPSKLVGQPTIRCLLLGLIMGLGAIASMQVPLQLSPGVIFDLRCPLVAAAAFLGGPVSAAIAASLSLTYRLFLSGSGLWAGCCNLVLCSAIGLVGHAISAGRPPGKLAVALLASAVAGATPLAALLLPRDYWSAGLPGIDRVILLTFGSTWVFVLSLLRDERHRKLVAQDAIYRAIIEALPDSLSAKDRESRFIAVNPATARLMGARSPDDLIGKTDADFYPPDMATMFRAEELTVLNKVVVGPVDQEVEFRDRSRRWITSMKTPMLDRHGAVVGILTHNRDVTDRKALEAELLKTQSYLQAAMAHMADGLVLYDREGIIRFCNSQYASMFPLTADLRVEGSRFVDIIRASVVRGEQSPKEDIESYLAQERHSLHRSDEKLLELEDGRSIELRSRELPGSDTLIVFTDITAKKQIERDLQRRASQDPLTGLANRFAFEFELDAAHRQALSRSGAYAILMLDLDRFKPVNDTFGHAVGDSLLVEVARRLLATVQDGTLVARLGGDEFACLVVADDIETATIRLANRLVNGLKRPFRLNTIELHPSGSLGIAYFPNDAQEPFELLRLADKALYAVKTRGGAGWAISAAEGEMRDAAKSDTATQSAA